MENKGLVIAGLAVAGAIFLATRKTQATPPVPEPGLASLVGVVYDDSTGLGVAGATVEIQARTVTTNNLGYFQINNLSLGSHYITVSKAGYQTLQAPVDLTDGVNQVNPYLHNLNPAPAPAPEPGVATVQGWVTDSVTGYRIGGALVTVGNNSDYTDSNGVYQITDLPVGNNLMSVTKTGYLPISNLALNLAAGLNTINPVLVFGGDRQVGEPQWLHPPPFSDYLGTNAAFIIQTLIRPADKLMKLVVIAYDSNSDPVAGTHASFTTTGSQNPVRFSTWNQPAPPPGSYSLHWYLREMLPSEHLVADGVFVATLDIV